ncbi:hypothetical protein [Bryobacter aggregatus]|uniref:hypothetical protein n=1 Tax=Bryobacter aggregatus TaxID=360054 RepID=UPI0004E14000|nr:hypothetical protein [Bryobacter aggregatus]
MTIEPNSEYAPPLDQLAGREFSFHPSIGNVATNLWRLNEANWSEFLVENVADQTQVWIPRRFLGELSESDQPVMIVGLNKVLEYKAGQVWPVMKRVIEMPRVPAGEQNEAIPVQSEPLPLRLDASEKQLGKLILGVLVGALALVAIVVATFRGAKSGDLIAYKAVVQESLGLGADDDYFAVVRKLGEPEADRWKADGESIRYRLLAYPKRNLNVILAGREPNDIHYVGAMDREWKVVDSVTQRGGSNTYDVLARLPRF